MSPDDDAETTAGEEPTGPAEQEIDAADEHGDEHLNEHDDEHDAADQTSEDLPHTGDDAVDRALESLPGIADADPAEQLDTYVGVHRALQDRLADSGV